MTSQNLLVELLVEELPPKSLKKLGESLAEVLSASLKAQGLVTADATVTTYASPRRLAVHVGDVAAKADDKAVSQKLMPASVGLDASGQATPALLKKLAALGVGVEVVPQLRREGEGKAESLVYDSRQTGATLADGLQKALEEALAKMPIPKVMTYQLADGWNSVQFVRPAHGVVALHGAEVVPVSVLGLQAGRSTQGHRFEAASAMLEIRDADSYEAQLENEGAVIPSFEKRRDEIVHQLAKAAVQAGGGARPIVDDALLDEVTALVERPNVLIGQFEAEYLEVPQECLILTMKANQKYFPLLDADGKLTNKFLIVSNIRPLDASLVIGGNERVVRPRLADAKFFFDQDRKKTLESRVEKLGNVVYHNKLGTQLQRTERVATLAGTIARLLDADKADAELAARLAKADLLTDMVGEFPELQGIMGRYYALHDGEDKAVADAIEAHYHPRFAGDTLPQGAIACAVALADKLETVVGIYGIGQVPTGEKDPFGLRRHALGILRILVETPLDLPLPALIRTAAGNFPAGMLSATVASDVEGFMLDRLRGYLRERDFEVSHIEAVLHILNGRMHEVLPRLQGVRAFAALEVAKDLAAANKRVLNIMRKNCEELGADLTGAAVKPALLKEAVERDLFQAMQDITPFAQGCLDRGEYGQNLKVLVTLKPFIDDFFEKVMVMCEDKELRLNRAALLQQLGRLMNQVADISRLAT
ncbi:MAG: glycine--tRNA ligase subunit beta [Betaproteobacteria bacterium RIFCSPLOWO2_12_61_14]|nr:MAG: glycine--tRNA ligase subunit beta [Betaproteobacteria bacterium RIFCSPLOWO2_12_61_14]